MTEYAELHAHSWFSLLDGASSPETLVETACQLGLHALALTDHDSLAGAVRFSQAAKRMNLHGIIGAEIALQDDCHLTLLAETQAGYANLCRLITASRLDYLAPEEEWLGKINPSLSWQQLAKHTSGLVALTGCQRGPVAAPLLAENVAQARQKLIHLRDLFGPDHLFVELQHHARPADDRLVRQLCTLAHELVLPVVATQNVHYAQQSGSRLHDALIAIRHILTLDEARSVGHLPLNSNAYLRGPLEMSCIFRERPDALGNTLHIAERCHATIDFSTRRLPHFATPHGSSEFAYLYELCHDNLPRRYPDLRPQVLTQLAHELNIIERAGLAGYFLIVWDIMRFAREQGIRGQGRGSAANSIVAYLLQITNIDPLQHNLLFERFLSEDKFTAPDIDLDFDTTRRDEVIHYVYGKYGRDHTAMVTNFVTYQARSTLRDLAKVLSFPAPVIDRLAKRLDTFSAPSAADDLLALVGSEEDIHATQAGVAFDAELAHHPLALLADLMRQIDGCPRHLGIHSGGMLITGPRLNEVVPQEPATMPGRIIVQWDKDSVEDAGLIKIDLLGLGMLGLISECVAMVETQGGKVPDLADLPLDDPAIYASLQAADTIGTFQVESRAQQQMLPRLKPEKFEDIVVSIAIIRPGPIQGNMVHPYLRRRHGLEPVSYWHPALEPVLQETLGVMLFQEQVLRTAMVLAGFSAGEADLLRRALSRSKPGPEMERLRVRFVEGAVGKGIDATTAEAVFSQLAGYAGFGFCKSHSASFALIAYQSLWLRHYFPAPYYSALLNKQPMGFYSPEVILGDARRHGVDILPPDVHLSAWGYTVAQGDDGQPVLRTGLSAVKALGEAGYAQLDAARQAAPFANLQDLLWRSKLPKAMMTNLIRAGAVDSLGDRRHLLWELGALEEMHDGFDVQTPVIEVDLPHLEGLQRTVWEYELLGHSPDGQILRYYRDELRAAGVLSTWQIKHATRQGQWVWVAGMVVVRQRPQTAKGIMFLSLEDESGLLDLVVKPDVYPTVRPVLQETLLIMTGGVVQKGEGVTSVLVERLQGL